MSTAHETADASRRVSGWRKSSRSGTEGNCVEVARLAGGGVAIRDSKRPGQGTLRLSAAEWDAFLGSLKAGRA